MNFAVLCLSKYKVCVWLIQKIFGQYFVKESFYFERSVQLKMSITHLNMYRLLFDIGLLLLNMIAVYNMYSVLKTKTLNSYHINHVIQNISYIFLCYINIYFENSVVVLE